MKKSFLIAAMAVASMSAMAQFRAEVGYLSTKAKVDGSHADDAMKSFKIGGYYMIDDIAIEKSVVEAGLTFAMGSYKEHNTKVKYSNFAIPVNAGYKIVISDEFSVRPYVGINFKFNTTYKTKTEEGPTKIEIDLLDSDEAHRFQLGGQLGGVVQWKQFTAGFQHQGDWTSLYDEGDKVTMPNNAFTVGIIF